MFCSKGSLRARSSAPTRYNKSRKEIRSTGCLSTAMASASASAPQHHQSYQSLSHALAYHPQSNDQLQQYSPPHPYAPPSSSSTIPPNIQHPSSAYYQPGPQYHSINQPPPDPAQPSSLPGASPGEKRKRGRPKGSKTKKPKVEHSSNTVVNSGGYAPAAAATATVAAVSTPITPALLGQSFAVATVSAPLTVGFPNQPGLGAPITASDQPPGGDIPNISHFKWQVMNLCSEFYQVSLSKYHTRHDLTFLPRF